MYYFKSFMDFWESSWIECLNIKNSYYNWLNIGPQRYQILVPGACKYYLLWEKNLGMGRLSYTLQVSSKWNITNILVRAKQGDLTEEKATGPQRQRLKRCGQWLEEARKKYFWEHPERSKSYWHPNSGPAMVILDFKPPERWENKFLLF